MSVLDDHILFLCSSLSLKRLCPDFTHQHEVGLLVKSQCV